MANAAVDPFSQLISKFNPDSDRNTTSTRWEKWLRRLDTYFVAKNIRNNDQKKAQLLLMAGTKVYDIYDTIADDADNFDQVKAKLSTHFRPLQDSSLATYMFREMSQNKDETVDQFVTRLKEAANNCDFHNKESEIRAQILQKTNNKKLRRNIFKNPNWTLNEVLTDARSLEQSELRATSMEQQQSVPPIDDNAEREVNKLHRSRPTHAVSKQRHSNYSHNYSKPTNSSSNNKCRNCGGNWPHKQGCPAKGKECHKCSKIGHFSKACRSGSGSNQSTTYSRKPTGKFKRVNNVVDEDYSSSDEGSFSVVCTNSKGNTKNREFKLNMNVNNVMIPMSIDTAADCSIMGKDTYDKFFNSIPIKKICTTLKTYSGEKLNLLGEIECKVDYNGVIHELPIIVAAYVHRPTLLGKDWLRKIKLDWGSICSVKCDATETMDKLLVEYQDLFTDSYEGIKGVNAHIRVKEGVQPIYMKHRSVPYAMKGRVETELRKLESNKVLVKVDRSEWATPIVVVPKTDNTVRICGDYKVTLNQAVTDEQYPLPNADDLYAELSGKKVFTKLDLSHAYAQLNLDAESKQYVTINTHMGLYAYTKLPYGIKSSPKIFQATMDKILKGLNCLCNQDDVLIATETKEANVKAVDAVFKRLAEYNLKLKRNKCEFLQSEVIYLGLNISQHGLRPVADKLTAIKNAPKPENVSQLRSFLGMVQYYSKFLPDLSTTLNALHQLLKKESEWQWNTEHQKAFDKCKVELTSNALLVYYDVERKLTLSCDASNYGVGAVICHIMDDGSERPIAYASRTLTKSEKNYAQIEKEALAIVFGIKRFHKYLLGRRFTLITDHKPLVTILGPKTGVPTMAACRMQRWAVLLSQYDYDIQHRKSEDNAVADALSRLPYTSSTSDIEGRIYQVSAIESDFPITAKDIAKSTFNDPVLSKVLNHVKCGWPDICPASDEKLKPYFHRKLELSCEGNCLLWGNRVIIPNTLRDKILKELHWEHPGVCAMKAIARSYVWWPKLDNDIEQVVRECTTCQSVRSTPQSAPLIPWKWPVRPFQRVHIDFCHKDDDNFLVVIDSHSKWIDVKHMRTITANRTIDELRLIFAEHGLPEEIVSDNGPQFTSDEFSKFLKQNNVKHTLSPPYHPQSNGAAERAVRVVKEALIKQVIDGKAHQSMKHRLANFLFRYRTTPHSTTGVTPAELMVKRKLRTRLSCVNPNLAEVVELRQQNQKRYKDGKTATEKQFAVDDPVRVKNPRAKCKEDKWLKGSVTKVHGPRTYDVLIEDSNCKRVTHSDQMIKAYDFRPKRSPKPIKRLDL